MSATVFLAAPKWQRLRGFRHGFQQPVLSGWISVDVSASFDRAALLAVVQAFFEEPLTAKGDSLDNVDLVRALLRTVGAVQRRCAIPAEDALFIRAMPHSLAHADTQHAYFEVAVPSFQVNASVEAINWALSLFNEWADSPSGSAPDTDAIHARLERVRQRLKPHTPQGINRFGMVQAALAAGIFCQPVSGGIYQFGTGAFARLLDSSLTDKTSAIGVQLAASKWLTTQMLRSNGLPAPRQVRVGSEMEAVQAAQSIGYPVVVKPENLEQGQGVAADLVTPAQVQAAYQNARKLATRILVEKHIQGHTHRLTVIDGEIVRVTRRQAGGVTGDGCHDVATLLEQLHQSEEYQRMSRRLRPSRLALDEEALGLLEQKGLTPHSVPAEGQYVRLRRRDNINAGGTNSDIELGDVHPANVQLTVNATRLLRLDYAGVDLISEDITQPWWENGAGICEVNARPQLGTRNNETHYYEQILHRLIGPVSHVPVHLELVVDPQDLTEVVARCPRPPVGCLASAMGLELGGGVPTLRTRSGFDAAQMALRRPDVRALTIVLTLPELQQHGLPFPFIETLNVTGDLESDSAAWPTALAFSLPHIKNVDLHADQSEPQTMS